MSRMTRIAGCAALMVAAVATPGKSAMGGNVVTVDPSVVVGKAAPDLWGIFLEDIDLALDGGLYAEMVRNRSFEDGTFDPWDLTLDFWNPVGNAEIYLDRSRPLGKRNRHACCVRGNPGAGIANEGYFGMCVKKGRKYNLSLMARGKMSGAVEASLEAFSKPVLARAEFTGITDEWQRFSVTLVPNDDDAQARLVLRLKDGGEIFIDCVSMFPADAICGIFRRDLVERLAALKPSFMRFPGGTFIKGDYIRNAYRWKETVGDVWERRTLRNFWKYWSTNGIGYHEYLLLAELLKAKPIYCINPGMAIKENVPLDKMDEFVQDALDCIEYANGSVDTKWGAMRAAAGHPEPFNMEYLEIGNEHGGKAYAERYAMIAKAVRAKYPEVKLIFDNWGARRSDGPNRIEAPKDIRDDHFYGAPERFMGRLAHEYDEPKGDFGIFVGEYAVTRTHRHGSLRAAIAEAAFMLGLERNPAQVKLAAYAPLFAHEQHVAWSPNLIYHSGDGSFVNPSWTVQKLFSENRGTQVLKVSVETGTFEVESGSAKRKIHHVIENVQASAMRAADGAIILKLVNCTEEPQKVEIRGVSGRVTKTVLTGLDRNARNTPFDREAVREREDSFDLSGFDTLPPLSLVIYSTGGRKAAFGAVSPDGLNELRLEVGEKGMEYSVWRRGKALVAPTDISLRTMEHGWMNGRNANPTATARKVGGTVSTPLYKKSEVNLAANETRVDFGKWAVVLHARNDGVAWRFETKFDGDVTVTAENTNVRFPKDAVLCYGQVGGFATSFERPATIGTVESVKSGHPQIVITPLTASVPGAGVVCVTESNLLDYPGLNFFRRDGESDMLRSWQAGVPSETERKGRWIRVKNRHPYLAKTSGGRAYPWRVFVLGDTPSDLVSSDTVYALAEPSRLDDTSWVKPGLVQWDWWHGFQITDVPGLKTGCNYETYRAYIDYASANGIPYIIMDEGWSEHLDLDKPRAEVNVEGVINYGREKGVGVILWAAWAMLYDPADRARVFDRYAAMGAKGFKIDFMDRDDQDLERFLENTAADAAKRKLVVMYHGIHKPTGLCRTFPNVLNYEGVYGLEQGHSRGGRPVVVSNDVNLVYTRMVAGAMDYTPGAMRNRAFDAPEFRKGKDAPACYGTRCHQLALFPLFEAPVQMLCDSPTQYRTASECFAFLSKVPTVWDETVGVAGEIGAFASVARRKGRDWWLGAITNWETRELELSTKFLGKGTWNVEAFEDAADADVNAEHYVRREFTVKAGAPIKVHLAPGGGFAARFSPCPGT